MMHPTESTTAAMHVYEMAAADLQDMKGSTVDSMSLAVDTAEVMLSCISLAYKESSNCRLEAQYG
jgi:hypothetical protein